MSQRHLHLDPATSAYDLAHFNVGPHVCIRQVLVGEKSAPPLSKEDALRVRPSHPHTHTHPPTHPCSHTHIQAHRRPRQACTAHRRRGGRLGLGAAWSWRVHGDFKRWVHVGYSRVLMGTAGQRRRQGTALLQGDGEISRGRCVR